MTTYLSAHSSDGRHAGYGVPLQDGPGAGSSTSPAPHPSMMRLRIFAVLGPICGLALLGVPGLVFGILALRLSSRMLGEIEASGGRLTGAKDVTGFRFVGWCGIACGILGAAYAALQLLVILAGTATA